MATEIDLEDQVKELRREVELLSAAVAPLLRQHAADEDYYQRGAEALG